MSQQFGSILHLMVHSLCFGSVARSPKFSFATPLKSRMSVIGFSGKVFHSLKTTSYQYADITQITG